MSQCQVAPQPENTLETEGLTTQLATQTQPVTKADQVTETKPATEADQATEAETPTEATEADKLISSALLAGDDAPDPVFEPTLEVTGEELPDRLAGVADASPGERHVKWAEEPVLFYVNEDISADLYGLREQFPSKIGGKPQWMIPDNLPPAESFLCQACQNPLVFLFQIYAARPATDPRTATDAPASKETAHVETAELGGRAEGERRAAVGENLWPAERDYHRTLLMFGCWRCGNSLKCFRCQLPPKNRLYPPCEQAPGDENLPPFFVHSEAQKAQFRREDQQLQVRAHLCRICGIPTLPKGGETAEASDEGPLATGTETGPLAGPVHLRCRNACLYKTGFDVLDERMLDWEYEEKIEEGHDYEQQLLQRCQQAEQFESDEESEDDDPVEPYDPSKESFLLLCAPVRNSASSPPTGGAGLAFEGADSAVAGAYFEQLDVSSVVANEKTPDEGLGGYLKYMNSVPEHVIRYGGERPLWFSSFGQRSKAAVPKCGNCGAERTFEFQVQSTLLNYLSYNQETDTNLELSWGTLAVYTCSASCVPKHGSYLLEYVYKQPDLTVHFRKRAKPT